MFPFALFMFLLVIADMCHAGLFIAFSFFCYAMYAEHSVHCLCVALMSFSLCLFTRSVIFRYVLFCLDSVFYIVVILCCLLCFCTYT